LPPSPTTETTAPPETTVPPTTTPETTAPPETTVPPTETTVGGGDGGPTTTTDAPPVTVGGSTTIPGDGPSGPGGGMGEPPNSQLGTPQTGTPTGTLPFTGGGLGWALLGAGLFCIGLSLVCVPQHKAPSRG
jgi:hypothetical protein